MAISFGNIVSQNGRLTTSSVTSGLDSKTIIDAIVSGKETQIKTNKDKITTNDKIVTSIGELRTLLETFKSAANLLRSPPGILNTASDAFKFRNVTLSTNTSIAASTYVSITAEPGAVARNYTLSDIALATPQTLRKDGFTSRTTSVVGPALTFGAGSFTLNGTSIELAVGDTLNDIKSKVNALSATTNIEADVIQISSSSFSLILKSTLEGAANVITEYNTGTGLIQFGADNETFTEATPAGDASFTFDGQAVTRSSNSFTDLVDDVTFSLLKATPIPDDGTEITAAITTDSTTIQNSVINFVNAYNDLKLFIAKQQQRDENGELLSDATLGQETALETILNGVSQQLNTLISGITTDDPDSLADLGITFEDYEGDSTNIATRNILSIDTDAMKSALTSSHDKFRRVFGYDFVANSSELRIFSRTNSATLTEYKVDIDLTRATGNQIRILNADTDAFLFNADYENGVITGQDDTDLEGAVLLYTGDDTATITVTATQGIADRIYNVLDSYLTSDTGLMDVTIDKYTELNNNLEDTNTRVNEDITTERDYLLGRFAQLEAALSKFNSALAYFDAFRAAQNSG